MPTPPRSYSPSAAERLRRALLALAASAATLTSHAQDAEGDFEDPDVLGEIPEDIEEGGAYAFFPCSNPGCKAEDCEGECQDGEPCAGCDTRSGDEEKTHAENAESAETKPNAESAEGAESDSHAENAESAESAPEPIIRGEAPRMPVRCSANAQAFPPIPIELTEADLKKLEAAGFDVSTAIHAATNAPAYSIAVETLSRALSAQAGYPITPELIVQAAKIAEMELEEFAREKLSELGIEPGATIDPPAPVPTATNATATPPPARLGGRRYPVPRTNP